VADKALTIGPSAPVCALWPEGREAMAVRALTCLRRGRVDTVGNLTAVTARDVLDLRNAGPGILAEIRAALAEHGLSLRDDEVAPAEFEARVRRLMRAGMKRGPALRFAREDWPKGEIAPGVTLEVAE
jgi:Bacterial RNA polymerase, alpha chain C terminal domain